MCTKYSKKWEKVWDEVTTCSKSCNRKRKEKNRQSNRSATTIPDESVSTNQEDVTDTHTDASSADVASSRMVALSASRAAPRTPSVPQ